MHPVYNTPRSFIERADSTPNSPSVTLYAILLSLFLVLGLLAILLVVRRTPRRSTLAMKASIWRGLMAIGMKFHHYAYPKPPRPSFKIYIPSRLSNKPGKFKLVFYVPDGYSDEAEAEETYPLVVNFHGGGFTLGTGTDDARWASAVVHKAKAVMVSVEYRLAPEYPFSVGVEDCTDALLYLAAHAEELRLDPHRIALSGFSAGGNFALAVPLILHDLRLNKGKRTLDDRAVSQKRSRLGSRVSSSRDLHTIYGSRAESLSRFATSTSQGYRDSPNASTLSVPSMRPANPRMASSTGSVLRLTDLEPTVLEMEHKVPDFTILCLVAFYPPTDFRIGRDAKRPTNPHPEKNLPAMLTNLFDESYIQGKHPEVDLSDPYLSPAAAEDSQLRDAYPESIVLYTCEYDMLNAEGVAFGERLKASPISKIVHGGLVKASVHGFDKKPNPLSFPVSADRCYSEACAELVRLFGGHATFEERRQLDKSREVDRFEEGVVVAPILDVADLMQQDGVDSAKVDVERDVVADAAAARRDDPQIVVTAP